jgi:hypothetical protein
MDAPPPRRRFSRRTLLRLAAAGVLAWPLAEAVRVFALANTHTVIDGKVYRTAQLSGAELERFIADKKIRTVINLRGICPETDWYQDECKATAATDISQEDITLSAKRLPAPAEIRRVVEVLEGADKPVVIHCQRGADRTGLVSTIAVLLLKENATLDEARRQLWPRYGHIEVGRTAVMDQFFDFYVAWLAEHHEGQHTVQRFREWATKHYCPGPYRAELALQGPDVPEVQAGRGFVLTVRATNTSVGNWVFRPGAAGGIRLRYQLFAFGGGEPVYKGSAGHRERAVKPEESIDLDMGFPPQKPGRYTVHADLLDTGPIDLLAADFVQYGSEPLMFNLTVK